MERERSAKGREENEIEFARIVAFSDGVFAIAITLLVLNLGISEHLPSDDVTQALLDQHQNLFAYALSFAVIGRFWIVHHFFFSEITKFDGRLLALNLFYLGWIVLIPFSSQVLGDYGDAPGAIVLYALNIAGVVLVGLWLISDARRAGFAKPATEETRSANRRALIVAAVFLLSVPVALVDVGIAQLIWLYLFLEPLFRRLVLKPG
jgi:uncharacterized membrane protein